MMGNAYYGTRETASTETEPTIIPLPTIDFKEEVELKSSLFKSNPYSPPSIIPRPLFPKKLLDIPSFCVHIGNFLDGLPLILNINRSRSISDIVLSTLGTTKCQLHPSIKVHLDALEEAISLRSCHTGIFKISSENGSERQYYRSFESLGKIFSDTLLAVILKDNSTSRINELGDGYEEAKRDKETTAHFGLFLDESGKPNMVKIFKNEATVEPLILESMTTCLPNTKYLVKEDNQNISEGHYGQKRKSDSNSYYQGLVSDKTSYLQALSSGQSLQFLFSPQELVANVVVPIANDVYETHHTKNRVHGDIKPSNILITENGAKLIDSRGCEANRIFAVYSPDWCPPEQILGKPITPASDVYSLAMLVLSILGGQIYGEIKNFQMPTASGKSVLQVLETEGIWLNPNCGLSDAARQAWKRSLATFLDFHPNKRPIDGKQFASQLKVLLEEFPLNNLKDIKLTWRTGNFSLSQVNPNCKISDQFNQEDLQQLDSLRVINNDSPLKLKGLPVWVVNDSYPSVS